MHYECERLKFFFSILSCTFTLCVCVCGCLWMWSKITALTSIASKHTQYFTDGKKRENGSTLLPSEFVCVWYLGISNDAMVSCVCVLMLNSVCRTFFLVHINSAGSKFLTHEHLRHICEKFESRWALKETRIRAHNHHHRREGAKTHGLQRIRSEKDEATHKIINIQCA